MGTVAKGRIFLMYFLSELFSICSVYPQRLKTTGCNCSFLTYDCQSPVEKGTMLLRTLKSSQAMAIPVVQCTLRELVAPKSSRLKPENMYIFTATSTIMPSVPAPPSSFPKLVFRSRETLDDGVWVEEEMRECGWEEMRGFT